MSVNVVRETRRYKQVAPIFFREPNCILKLVQFPVTQLERCKAASIHCDLVGVLDEREIVSASFQQNDLSYILLVKGKE